MKNRIFNKFFSLQDEKTEVLDDYRIPAEWWSRFYEYHFASLFAEENDVTIDAGSGSGHPFKEYLSKKVKLVYAVDNDPDICTVSNTEKLKHVYGNIEKMDSIPDNSVDKIFCISVFEHLKIDKTAEPLNVLKEFAKKLKKGGLVVLTMDYPYLEPEELIKTVEQVEGLEFYGEIDYTKPDDAIHHEAWGLNCFSAVLEKK